MRTQNSLVKGKSEKQSFSVAITGASLQNLIKKSVPDAASAARFTGALISAVSANERLKNCNPATIVAAALRGEGQGLTLGREYHVVPFGDSAAYVIGYKGLLTLLIATGDVADTDCVEVREGEYVGRDPRTKRRKFDFSVYETDEEAMQHPVIGYYFYVELKSGYFRFEYMTIDELLRHADSYVPYFSLALYNKWRRGEKLTQEESRKIGISYDAYIRVRDTGDGTPAELKAMQELGKWYAEGGAQVEMMKKTVIRKLLNSGYIRLANTAAIKDALAYDNAAGEGIIPDFDIGSVDMETGEVIETTGIVSDAPDAPAAPENAGAANDPASAKAVVSGEKTAISAQMSDEDFTNGFFGGNA